MAEEQAKEPEVKKEPALSLEDIKKLLDEKLTPFEEKVSNLSSNQEALKDSWDATLEQMELDKNQPQADIEEFAPEAKPEPAAPATPAPKTEQEVVKAEEKSADVSDERILQDLEGALKEEDSFKEEVRQELEDTKLQFELDKLEPKYPHANVDEVLLAIEDGSDQTTEELFKESQEKRLAEIAKIKEEAKRELAEANKEASVKEEEGVESVPQSSASPVSMPKESTQSASSPERSADNDWAKAMEKARVEHS